MAIDQTGTQEMLDDVYKKAEERFGLDNFIAKMVNLLILNAFETQSSGYWYSA